jgi:hypothetical protein
MFKMLGQDVQVIKQLILQRPVLLLRQRSLLEGPEKVRCQSKDTSFILCETVFDQGVVVLLLNHH